MTRRTQITVPGGAAVVALAALTLAACGGGDNGAAAATAAPSGQTGTIDIASAGGLGRVLVDSHGRTLYLFKKDRGTRSACSGACGVAWPPVRVGGRPSVGSGLSMSKVGTTRRSDGRPQVTYNDHPLYRFNGDSKPGDANGQGVTAFGAGWFVVSPAGNEVSARSASPGTGGY